MKESPPTTISSKISCDAPRHGTDSQIHSSHIINDNIGPNLGPMALHAATQRKELPLRLTTKEQDHAMSLSRHRQTWSIPQASGPVIENRAFYTLGPIRDSNYFEPSQMRYSQSAPCFTGGNAPSQTRDLQNHSLQGVLYTVAHREVATPPQLPPSMHYLARGSKNRPKACGSLAKVDELYERPRSSKTPSSQLEPRKRKRVLSNDEQQMKASMTAETSHKWKSEASIPISEGAVSQRFCPICDSTHCHHIIKEQTLSPIVPPMSGNVGEQKIPIDPGSPRDALPLVQAQRRHTADTCYQSMQALSCTAPGPRRSLPFEHGNIGPRISSPTRISRPPSLSLTADSGYSTATGTSPGTRTSRSRTHDPTSDDEQAQQTAVVLSKAIQQARLASTMSPVAQEPVSKTLPFPVSSPRPQLRKDDQVCGSLAIYDTKR